MGKNIMVFTLGGQSFGLEAVKVESILHQPPVKALEVGETNVLGISEIHGKEVRVYDAYAILHLPAPSNKTETVVAMNTSDQNTVAIPIDHADGIVDAEDREMNIMPEILNNVPVHYISGVVSHNGKLILLLNPDAF